MNGLISAGRRQESTGLIQNLTGRMPAESPKPVNRNFFRDSNMKKVYIHFCKV